MLNARRHDTREAAVLAGSSVVDLRPHDLGFFAGGAEGVGAAAKIAGAGACAHLELVQSADEDLEGCLLGRDLRR